MRTHSLKGARQTRSADSAQHAALLPLSAHPCSCFDSFEQNSQLYGECTALGLAPSCEQSAVRALVTMRKRMTAALDAWNGPGQQQGEKDEAQGAAGKESAQPAHHGRAAMRDIETTFYSMVNALVVADAERYYREMFRGRVSSWNIRDTHMVGSGGRWGVVP